MPKHELYDFIVAKAANVDLVVFEKVNGGVWKKLSSYFPEWFHDCEYFLCLPKFEKECLHWLNGGEVQEKGIRASEHYWSDSTDVGVWARDWHEDHIFMCEVSMFRIKPETININGHEVPAPYRGEMEEGQKFWIPSLKSSAGYEFWKWNEGRPQDAQDLKRGLVHLTPEAAEAHGKALLSFTK